MIHPVLKPVFALLLLLFQLGCDGILLQPTWNGCPDGPRCEPDMQVDASPVMDAETVDAKTVDMSTIDAALLPDMGIEPIVPCPLETEIVGANEITWVCIEGGEFTMGRNDGGDNQGPAHPVRVPTFWMTKSEITVAQYRSCVSDVETPCVPPNVDIFSSNYRSERDREAYPMDGVNINAVSGFLRFLGDEARLPTESEWEFAASGRGTQSPYPWGDSVKDCESVQTNLIGGETQCELGGARPVCSGDDISVYGLCDLMGNLSEWTADDYHGRYDCSDGIDITGCAVGSIERAPDDGSSWTATRASAGRVVRGGSFSFGEGDTQTHRVSIWARRLKQPDISESDLGFRVVRTTMP